MARGAKQPTMPDNAIEARGLDKIYRSQGGQPEKHALKAVDLTVPRGSMFGLLGPNGAGKSTFINILAGLVLKTGGTLQVWGRDVDQQPRGARAAIGVVPQELSLDAFFTPREIMEVQAGLYGVAPKNRRTMEILDAVGLADQADAYARSLSGGMQRRLLVAKALVHNPPVLVLDEPTAGVDVKLRQQLWSYVRDLNRQGTTIVLTTHYLQEAEELCDRIAIIDDGKVIACEPTRELVGRLDHKALHLTVDRDMTTVPEALQGLSVDLMEPRQLMIRYRRSDNAIDQILSAVRASGLTVVDLSTEEADLEDVFLELTRGGDGQPTDSQR